MTMYKTIEYTLSIGPFGCVPATLEEGVIYVAMEDDVERSVSFLCPCGCGLQTYIPFGKFNNEGGSGERRLIWHEPRMILSLEPSIEVRGGCRSHYHIKFNKVV